MLQALGRRGDGRVGGMHARLTMGTVKEASAEVVISAPIEVFCPSYRSCAHHFLARSQTLAHFQTSRHTLTSRPSLLWACTWVAGHLEGVEQL